jgi:hypothetical protein
MTDTISLLSSLTPSGRMVKGFATANPFTPTVDANYIFHEHSRDLVVWFLGPMENVCECLKITRTTVSITRQGNWPLPFRIFKGDCNEGERTYSGLPAWNAERLPKCPFSSDREERCRYTSLHAVSAHVYGHVNLESTLASPFPYFVGKRYSIMLRLKSNMP